VSPPPAGLWTPPPGATPASGNYIYLQSNPGDFIGQGLIETYTPATHTIDVTEEAGHLNVRVNGSRQWIGDFQGMSFLTQLQPGYYGGVHRYPFGNPTKGGLSWSGEGRGCNVLDGWFVVDSVSYAGGAMKSIDLRFEQVCEGSDPPLHGQIHWMAQ
jgi:hypothetical protein